MIRGIRLWWGVLVYLPGQSAVSIGLSTSGPPRNRNTCDHKQPLNKSLENCGEDCACTHAGFGVAGAAAEVGGACVQLP